MPLLLDSHSSKTSASITIGLINNMPDEALKATERQFLSLLEAASNDLTVHLSLYSLPGVPRNDSSRHHMASLYSSVTDMWHGRLDGLIVTGREPLAADLKSEPYWDAFSKTLVWAQENTHSTVWSCLAAHAAVLHLDGIARVRRSDKLFGIFECSRAADHPLLARMPVDIAVPHSRWNSLPEDQLAEHGYCVLTRANDAEVDTFIKQQKSLFVFFQGHPEYEADTLMREYRRDIGRFFSGQTSQYPLTPQGYFGSLTTGVLDSLRERTLHGKADDPQPKIVAALNTIGIENTWYSSAKRIYSNWLRYIAQTKKMTQRPCRTVMSANRESHAAATVAATAAEA